MNVGKKNSVSCKDEVSSYMFHDRNQNEGQKIDKTFFKPKIY